MDHRHPPRGGYPSRGGGQRRCCCGRTTWVALGLAAITIVLFTLCSVAFTQIQNKEHESTTTTISDNDDIIFMPSNGGSGGPNLADINDVDALEEEIVRAHELVDEDDEDDEEWRQIIHDKLLKIHDTVKQQMAQGKLHDSHDNDRAGDDEDDVQDRVGRQGRMHKRREAVKRPSDAEAAVATADDNNDSEEDNDLNDVEYDDATTSSGGPKKLKNPPGFKLPTVLPLPTDIGDFLPFPTDEDGLPVITDLPDLPHLPIPEDPDDIIQKKFPWLPTGFLPTRLFPTGLLPTAFRKKRPTAPLPTNHLPTHPSRHPDPTALPSLTPLPTSKRPKRIKHPKHTQFTGLPPPLSTVTTTRRRTKTPRDAGAGAVDGDWDVDGDGGNYDYDSFVGAGLFPTPKLPKLPPLPTNIVPIPTGGVPKLPDLPTPKLPPLPTEIVPIPTEIPDIPDLPTPKLPKLPKLPPLPTEIVPIPTEIPDIPDLPTPKLPKLPKLPPLPTEIVPIPTDIPDVPDIPLPTTATTKVSRGPAPPPAPTPPGKGTTGPRIPKKSGLPPGWRKPSHPGFKLPNFLHLPTQLIEILKRVVDRIAAQAAPPNEMRDVLRVVSHLLDRISDGGGPPSPPPRLPPPGTRPPIGKRPLPIPTPTPPTGKLPRPVLPPPGKRPVIGPRPPPGKLPHPPLPGKGKKGPGKGKGPGPGGIGDMVHEPLSGLAVAEVTTQQEDVVVGPRLDVAVSPVPTTLLPVVRRDEEALAIDNNDNTNDDDNDNNDTNDQGPIDMVGKRPLSKKQHAGLVAEASRLIVEEIEKDKQPGDPLNDLISAPMCVRVFGLLLKHAEKWMGSSDAEGRGEIERRVRVVGDEDDWDYLDDGLVYY